MRRCLPPLLVVGLLLFADRQVHGHEPLWGETPQTFSFGIVHPEIKYEFHEENRLLRGSARLDNPDGHRRTTRGSHLSLQYAPRTEWNVKLEIPYAQVNSEERAPDGQIRRSSVSGLGDLLLSAKGRFRADFGPNWKTMHAYTVGLQLPTGENRGREPDGALLHPHEQPGTGNWGVQLGYAFAYERLQDTTWASAMYRRDATGRRRRGDMLTLDTAYGYWVRPARRPQDLGIILAVGPHLTVMGKDRVERRSVEDSGRRMLGLQATLITTQSQYQGRVGLLVPVYQRVNGTQLGSGIEVRAGVEALF